MSDDTTERAAAIRRLLDETREGLTRWPLYERTFVYGADRDAFVAAVAREFSPAEARRIRTRVLPSLGEQLRRMLSA